MILSVYVTMLPLLLGGILNMVFTKTAIYKRYKSPIDAGKCFSDGKRILGDNKTWIGFISMIVIYLILQIVWGFVNKICNLESMNELYLIHKNTVALNCLAGFLFGFSYMLFELPNSFIKRRIDIQAGKTLRGIKGVIFFIIDQIDSLVGVFLVLWLFNKMSFGRYLTYLMVGMFTHIGVNLILFFLKVRKNI